jgi:4,5-DOPA dioxygenase extradiol
VQYPAAGSPALATAVRETVTGADVEMNTQWGLDHGTWSVVKHIYPKADIPIVQLSLDHYQTPQFHYDLGAELAPLREKGILIIGSGNLVHNLARVDWNRLNDDNYGYDWAIEANNRMKELIRDGDHRSLINYRSQGKAFDLSIPTAEHFMPLLYILAMKKENENVSIFNDKAVGGSLTMTSIKID